MKVMLVDDSRAIRNIIKNALKAIPGIEFAEAGDGVEALNLIKTTPGGFACLVVDWNMPNMDGITLVRTVREFDKRTPMMMVTTEAEKEHVQAAIKAGINGYALKPFTADVILAKVQQLLSKAAA